jgi:hypothetical protein
LVGDVRTERPVKIFRMFRVVDLIGGFADRVRPFPVKGRGLPSPPDLTGPREPGRRSGTGAQAARVGPPAGIRWFAVCV